ncbi:GDSL-type esterase/lipase family protein [Gaetbulibacter aestuarii]|uniref:GDSL-type esterase/lipase family protein n=1 Tax=Gaetbulibacter aestuarii TaxID=1502358 RepID=A0ABW7N0J0_9FLAO
MKKTYDPQNDKTIGFCPEYYDDMVEAWSKMPVVAPEYLFLGDSITEQGNWVERLQNKTVLNHGIKGDISISVLRRLDETIRQQPKTILLMIGTNDLAKDIPETEVIKNTFEIIRRLHEGLSDTTIFLQSILPVNNTIPAFEARFDNAEAIQNINRALIQPPSELTFNYLDLHEDFKDEHNRLISACTTDGLHLTEKGYQHWLNILKEEGIIA